MEFKSLLPIKESEIIQACHPSQWRNLDVVFGNIKECRGVNFMPKQFASCISLKIEAMKEIINLTLSPFDVSGKSFPLSLSSNLSEDDFLILLESLVLKGLLKVRLTTALQGEDIIRAPTREELLLYEEQRRRFLEALEKDVAELTEFEKELLYRHEGPLFLYLLVNFIAKFSKKELNSHYFSGLIERIKFDIDTYGVGEPYFCLTPEGMKLKNSTKQKTRSVVEKLQES